VGSDLTHFGKPASRGDMPNQSSDPAEPAYAAIIELRLPTPCQPRAGKSAGPALVESDSSDALPRSGESAEADEWIARQLKSAPALTEERWRRITNLIYRQTTSTRSGEKRPPLTAAGLITAAASTDSMTARR
jgi:hypothetical protein